MLSHSIVLLFDNQIFWFIKYNVPLENGIFILIIFFPLEVEFVFSSLLQSYDTILYSLTVIFWDGLIFHDVHLPILDLFLKLFLDGYLPSSSWFIFLQVPECAFVWYLKSFPPTVFFHSVVLCTFYSAPIFRFQSHLLVISLISYIISFFQPNVGTSPSRSTALTNDFIL